VLLSEKCLVNLEEEVSKRQFGYGLLIHERTFELTRSAWSGSYFLLS
jgi:hypothetical protein